MRKIILGASVALVSCAPVENSHPPAITQVATGKVVTVADAVGETGESQAGRVAVGFLAGGLAGAAIAGNTEKDIGQSRLFQYTLLMTDGSTSSVRSFSIVAVDDCVKVTKIGDKAELVLERTNVVVCSTAAAQQR